MAARQLERLIVMAEQIALNLGAGHDALAAERTATHIQRFWTPAMREQLIDHWRRDGELTAVLAAAIATLHDSPTAGSGTT
jgi:formate dehydrogenase subunit delta